MTEEIHVAFWTYRLTYFGKIGVLSRAYRRMERKLFEVLRLQGIARSLLHKREEEEAGERFANKFRLSVQQGVRFFVKYGVCLPLGFVTFGSFWTKDIRKFIFYNHSDMASDEFEMLRKEMESLKEEQMAFVREENRELVQLQMKQSEQMASIREENLKLVELQMKQSEMSQKQAEDMMLLIETCQRLGSIKQESE
jgi:hypothetical protein